MMDLPALPALADHDMWMLHGCVPAFARDPGHAESAQAASDARRLALASILVMHRHGGPFGSTKALHARLRGLCGGVAHERIAQPCTASVEPDRPVIEANAALHAWKNRLQ